MLLIGSAIAAAGYAALVAEVSEQTRVEFDIAARERFAAFRSAVHVQVERVRLVQGFMAALPVDDEWAFDRAVAGTSARDAALRALEWAPRVTAEARGAFEARAGFGITERDGAGRLTPAGARPAYVPVTFVDPLAGNERAVGFDLASEARRAAAIEAAFESGQVSASAPISLVQADKRDSALLLVGPVLEGDRRRGVVLAVVEVDTLVVGASGDSGIEIAVADAAAGPFGVGVPPAALGLARIIDPWQTDLEVGGRTWRVTLRPSTGWLARHHAARLWVFPFMVLLLSAGIAVFTLRYRDRARRLEAEARRRREVEHDLRELNGTLEARVARATEEARAEHAELLRAQERIDEGARQLQQAQKMEAFGQLAGGIAHDFNNMLVAVIGTADMALAGIETGGVEGVAEDLAEIRRVGQMAADLTRQLLAFSRQQALAPRPVDVSTLVRDVAGMSRRVLDASIHLHLEGLGESRWASIDPTQLEQVLVNLILNARDAMLDGGELRVRVDARALDDDEAARSGLTPGPYVVVDVDDSGVGMTPEIVERIFEPFFTTKQPGHGTGLGLSTCLGIIAQSGGRIDVRSTPGEGTRFTLLLPATDAPEPSEPQEITASMNSGGETVLVVEDEAPVRALMTRVLRGAGYVVLAAVDALDSSVVGAGRSIDLLLTDLSMPGLNGVDLAMRLHAEQRDLRVLVVSGHPKADARLGQGEYPFLAKPFTPAELLRAVRDVLDAEPVGIGGKGHGHRG